MNIKTLRVQNFRNFEDKTFEFSEGFNLIIGDNGTGKTALLEAICLSLGNVFSRLPAWYYSTRQIRSIGAFQGQTLTLEQQFPLKIEIFAKVNSQTLIQQYEFDSDAFFNHVGNLGQEISLIQSKIRQGEAVTAPIICYYSTARLWLDKQEDGEISIFDDEVITPNSRLKAYENTLDIAINNKTWLKWLARMKLISLQDGQTIQVYEAIKKAMQNCLEGCDHIDFDLKRGQPIARVYGRVFPFGFLSDGQRSMLAMVADIAYRMAQLNPHLLENVTLETPGVVLIDELDLHLHPKWQRKVVDNLRKAFPKVQFFATTHSPFIIQSVRQGELIDLNETEGAAEYQDKSIEDIAEYVMDVDLPQLSERKQQMLDAAKAYYSILENAKSADTPELEELKTKLDRLSMPFSDNVAYHAFLEFKRVAALKE